MKPIPARMSASVRHRPFGIIDIGSNSARLVVYRCDGAGQLMILASERATMWLVRDVDREGTLTPQAIENTIQALADFRAVAVGAGANRHMQREQVLRSTAAGELDLHRGAELLEAMRWIDRIAQYFTNAVIHLSGASEKSGAPLLHPADSVS